MLSADGPDDWPEEWAGAEDEGEELAAEELEELFNVYYQGEKIKKRLISGKGTGKGKGKAVKKAGQCRDCQAYGHWSGDPERPK
eukprot:15632540-Heterocapsa_arctica.AAC.1